MSPHRLKFLHCVAALLSAAWILAATPARAQFMQRASVGDFGSGGPFDAGCDLSADGRYVVVNSIGQLSTDDTNNFEDVYLKDMVTGAIEVVSVANDGSLANGRSYMGRVSDDGSVVVFASEATNLVDGDTNGFLDVFVRDRVAGTTVRVSIDENGGQTHSDSLRPDVSGDGHLVAFESRASLVAGDTDSGEFDIYAFDRNSGQISRVSAGFDGGNPGNDCLRASVDATGRHVAFYSNGDLIVENDTNGAQDVFVRDLELGSTIRVSVDSNGNQVFGHSLEPSISSDGSIVAFESASTGLVANDTNGEVDIFVHDQNNGNTRRVSVASDGSEANDRSHEAAITGDGNLVVFNTLANNLLATPNMSNSQVLIRDRVAKTTTLVSESTLGRAADHEARTPAISTDGRFVAFYSNATNLIPRDPVGGIYRRDLLAPPDFAFALDYGEGFAGTLGVPVLYVSAAPSLGTTMTLGATNSYGAWTLGLLVTGFSPTSLVLRGGGTLLASPDLLNVVPVPPWDFATDVVLPFDEQLAGLEVFEQMLELDYGAPALLSFTAGLQLHFGR